MKTIQLELSDKIYDSVISFLDLLPEDECRILENINTQRRTLEETPELASERIVAFVDILGFKEKMKTITCPCTKEIDLWIQIFSDIKRKVDTAYQEIVPGCGMQFFPDLEVTMMSDAVVISAPLNSQFQVFLYAGVLANLLIQQGHFVRGGIAKGFLYHQKEIVFGKGLIKAYEIETKQAIYPRIIVDETLIKYLKNEGMFLKPLDENGPFDLNRKTRNIYCIQDNDGAYVFNYFQSPFSRAFDQKHQDLEVNRQKYFLAVKEHISNWLTQEHRGDIKLKANWLASFFNKMLPEKYKDSVGPIII